MYGISLPLEHRYTRVFTIKASPELIYDLAIDAESQDSWRQDISKITMHPGKQNWIEHTKQGDISFKIIEEKRPSTFSLEFRGQGLEGTWEGEFTPGTIGTKVSLVENISVHNPFFRALSKLTKFTEKFMDRYMHDLKVESERRSI